MLPADSPQLIEFSDQNFFLVHHLLKESKADGYNFIERTIDDWNSGTNKFSKPGEKLWGLVLVTDPIAIGGLNHDPYAGDENVARVRHLYVREAYRRKGHASVLMRTIIDEAKRHFTHLRLYTDNPAAGKFYETLGFQKVSTPKASHVLNF
ncbi:GNAT family N-acetyltransferase [Mucilaginibacter ginsenosidivorans]|nr:GNAT family N-acetyltransferase [Mucilaginibacter ginsenosidivorans]